MFGEMLPGVFLEEGELISDIGEPLSSCDIDLDPDFENPQLYGDICHLPVNLKRKIVKDLEFRSRYCEVFSKISKVLKNHLRPTMVDIVGIDLELARYALHYLLDILEELHYISKDLDPCYNDARLRKLVSCS